MVHSVDEDRTWLQSSSVFIYNYVIEPIPTLITQTENIYKLWSEQKMRAIYLQWDKHRALN